MAYKKRRFIFFAVLFDYRSRLHSVPHHLYFRIQGDGAEADHRAGENLLVFAALEITHIACYFSLNKASHVAMPEGINLLQGGASQGGQQIFEQERNLWKRNLKVNFTICKI